MLLLDVSSQQQSFARLQFCQIQWINFYNSVFISCIVYHYTRRLFIIAHNELLGDLASRTSLECCEADVRLLSSNVVNRSSEIPSLDGHTCFISNCSLYCSHFMSNLLLPMQFSCLHYQGHFYQ